MRLAARMGRLGTETAFEMLARARALEVQGRSIVHLEIGEPDFDTPENIQEAAVRAIRGGYSHYGPAAGFPELRRAIAGHVARTRGVPVEPDEVVVTPGAKPIIFFTMMSFVEDGDEVIVPDPGFPIYASMVEAMGGKAVPVPLREEDDWGLDLEALRRAITAKTKLLVINTPHNPTGGVLSEAHLRIIARLAEEHDLWVLSDEIYSRISYGAELSPSFLSVPGTRDRTILLDGYSKSFAMTGWRAGFGVMPRALAEHFARLMTNSASCTASFTQMACIEALAGPQDAVARMVAEFRARRDLVVAGLRTIDAISCRTPQGAFYVFPNVTKLGRSSTEVQNFLLDEAGVATLAGTAFGKAGEGYLRLSYAASRENLEKALSRLREFVPRLAAKRVGSGAGGGT